jgi:hypothetical protein
MPKGIDVRQTTGSLGVRAFFQGSDGALVSTGTCHLRLYELQDSGTLKSYDWSDHTFKYGALTAENTGMVPQSGNNNTRATAIWTAVESILTGFTEGGIYLTQVEHSSASPSIQTREFQFGEAQGDGLNSYADALLERDLGSVVAEADRSVVNALRFLRNKWSISGGTLTVYEEDDTTIAWTATLSTSAADPVTGSDPS